MRSAFPKHFASAGIDAEIQDSNSDIGTVPSARLLVAEEDFTQAAELHSDRRGAALKKSELHWTPAGEWHATVILLKKAR